MIAVCSARWCLAQVPEIRAALEDFRTSGKFVHAWLEFAGDREYYLASAADRIYLLPSASLDLTGVATYEVFLRGTFDWIGTYPDFLHVGDYKTAVNTFLEKTYTPAHREMSESLTRSHYDQLVRAAELQYQAGKRSLLQLVQLLDSRYLAQQRRAEERYKLLAAQLRFLALRGDFLPAMGVASH